MAKKSRARGAPYVVGYKQTPIETRYPPGTSGNLAGRPRKTKPAPPGDSPAALDDILVSVMDEAVPIQGVRGIAHVSGYEALLRSLRDEALAGDLRAAKLLLPQYLEAKARREEAARRELEPELREILRAAVAEVRARKMGGHPSQPKEERAPATTTADQADWGTAPASAEACEAKATRSATSPGETFEDARLGRPRTEGAEPQPIPPNALRPSASDTPDFAGREPRAKCQEPPAWRGPEPVRVTRPVRQVRQRNEPLIADRHLIKAHGW